MYGRAYINIMQNLYVNSTTIILYGPVIDLISGSVVTDADASFVLKSTSGEEIDNGAGELLHVSEGLYRASMTPEIEPDTKYYLELTVEAGGATSFKRFPLFAVYDDNPGYR